MLTRLGAYQVRQRVSGPNRVAAWDQGAAAPVRGTADPYARAMVDSQRNAPDGDAQIQLERVGKDAGRAYSRLLRDDLDRLAARNLRWRQFWLPLDRVPVFGGAG